jgi:hypothetical protein
VKEHCDGRLADPAGLASLVNKLTSNELESDAAAQAWLDEIYRAVFQ